MVSFFGFLNLINPFKYLPNPKLLYTKDPLIPEVTLRRVGAETEVEFNQLHYIVIPRLAIHYLRNPER